LKQRFPVLEALGTMASPTPFILPERLPKTDAFTQITEVDGSGPFKFAKEEWQPGHKAVFVKNPGYIARAEPPNNTAGGKVVKVDRVEWLYVPEAVTAVQALESGEVAYLENAPSDYASELSKNPDITVLGGYPGFIGTVRFNHLYPPFDSVKMRQAVLAVADQRDYMAAHSTSWNKNSFLSGRAEFFGRSTNGNGANKRKTTEIWQRGYSSALRPVEAVTPSGMPKIG
jgi:peptide/nickel transport system substrate-binding protein